MSGFIKWLEDQNVRDTKVKAILRRSSAFAPGTFMQAYPYVEPFVKGVSEWHRAVHYLVAALWAIHCREGRDTGALSIGEACADYFDRIKSKSIERRFISLLDADIDQLPHRLRQMVVILKDYQIDFDAVLEGLKYWENERKLTQNQWARDFYRFIDQEERNESNLSGETTE